jgi:hypothetical protein
MSKIFEAKGDVIPAYEAWGRGWLFSPLFEGMECFHADLGDGKSAVFLYPDPADLRKRLAVLKADPTLIVDFQMSWFCLPEEKDINHVALVPGVIAGMHNLVDTYEMAFASKSEWTPVHLRLFDLEEKEWEEAELAIDSAPGPEGEDDDGEGLVGEEVEWGAPSLMEGELEGEGKYEETPSWRHREPCITFLAYEGVAEKAWFGEQCDTGQIMVQRGVWRGKGKTGQGKARPMI